MTAFSIRDIDDLKPQERRYDVPIEDDLVVSVLPNGIKTWVYVYQQDGRMQRRTLGVYPDMGPAAARVSLDAARQTRQALREAMERSTRAIAARPEPAVPRSPSWRFAPAGALVVGLIVAAGAYVGLREQAPAGISEERDASTQSTNSLQAEAALTPAIDTPPDAPSALSTAASGSATSSLTPEPAPQTTDGAHKNMQAKSAAARDVPPPTRTTPGTARDTHVARAVLTSDVVRREPVDAIGPELHGDPGDIQQVFFFTELRGLAGQSLHYRWLRNGRVEAEVPLAVGTTWRWRSYSRKDLLPDQTGEWRVQLIDDAEHVLAESDFIYRNDPPGRQSADAN